MFMFHIAFYNKKYKVAILSVCYIICEIFCLYAVKPVFLSCYVEKLFRTAQDRIFQMRTKQTERRERKNIKTTLCRAKKE